MPVSEPYQHTWESGILPLHSMPTHPGLPGAAPQKETSQGSDCFSGDPQVEQGLRIYLAGLPRYICSMPAFPPCLSSLGPGTLRGRPPSWLQPWLLTHSQEMEAPSGPCPDHPAPGLVASGRAGGQRSQAGQPWSGSTRGAAAWEPRAVSSGKRLGSPEQTGEPQPPPPQHPAQEASCLCPPTPSSPAGRGRSRVAAATCGRRQQGPESPGRRNAVGWV